MESSARWLFSIHPTEKRNGYHIIVHIIEPRDQKLIIVGVAARYIYREEEDESLQVTNDLLTKEQEEDASTTSSSALAAHSRARACNEWILSGYDPLPLYNRDQALDTSFFTDKHAYVCVCVYIQYTYKSQPTSPFFVVGNNNVIIKLKITKYRKSLIILYKEEKFHRQKLYRQPFFFGPQSRK